MVLSSDAHSEFIDELPEELKDSEEYLKMGEYEDEKDYCELFGYNQPCLHCTNPGNLGINCILCQKRPFGQTPCTPDLHCFKECDGEGSFCEFSAVCDLIVETEGPLAEIAKRLFGDEL